MMKMAVVSLAAFAALTFGCAVPVGTGDPSTDPALGQENVGADESAIKGNDHADDEESDDETDHENKGKGCEKGHRGKNDHANKCGSSSLPVSS
jgi:hypothetical protein